MAVLQGNGPNSAVTFDLLRERVTIGRRPENDIAIDWDPSVSRRHAEMELVSGCWFVEDLGATNGTFVNGKKIEGRRPLHVDDELRVGDTILWLRGMVSSDQWTPTSPSEKPPELTRKQAEVVRELCRPQVRDPRSPCATVKDIAGRMYVGEAAVKAHLSTLYGKFEIPEAGTNRRALLAKKAWESGVVRQTDFDDDESADG